MFLESIRRLALGAFLVFALAAAQCGGPEDDPARLIGSTWLYEIEVSRTDVSTGSSLDLLTMEAATVTRFTGRFVISDRLIEDSNDDVEAYELDFIPGTTVVDYHSPGFNIFVSELDPTWYRRCEEAGGTISAPGRGAGRFAFSTGGEPFVADMFESDGRQGRIFDLSLGAVAESGHFSYWHRCVDGWGPPPGAELDMSGTESVPPQGLWGHVLAREGTYMIGRTIVAPLQVGKAETATLKLRCISGCEEARDTPVDPAPEETGPECNVQALRDRCQRFRNDMHYFCSTLEDWVIIYSDSEHEESEFTCATEDCATQVDANRDRRPWSGVTHMLDSACEGPDAGELVCSVECYGFGDFER